MYSMCEWADPNEFSAVFRLTSSEFADEFMEKGSIKFNTPQSWVDYSKAYGTGRGDAYESTIAFCDIFDDEKVVELHKKYSPDNVLDSNSRPLITEIIGQQLLFKDERSLQLPCFCVYVMKNSLFPCPDSVGKHKITADIPASYFRDFSDNSTPENIKKKPLEAQPALIIISDFNEFQKVLRHTLSKLGLEDTEILIECVSYFNFEEYGSKGWMDFNRKFPKELFVKSTRFNKQSEARVIINTTKSEIIKRLHDAPIELGCMKDIAKVLKEYLCDGLHVETIVDICEK